MVKESESATEESPTEEKPVLAQVPEATEPSPDDDLVRATIDPRRNVAKTTKSKEEQESDAQKKREAYLALAMQMDDLADSIDARRPPRAGDTYDRASIQEENIVRQSKTSAEAFPALRGVQVSSDFPVQSQPPQQHSVPQTYSDKFQQNEQPKQEAQKPLEETFVTVTESQQQEAGRPSEYDEDEEIISVSQQESPEEEAPESPVASKPHVSFADEAITQAEEAEITKRVAKEEEGPPSPPPSPSEKSEEDEESHEITEIVETYRVTEDGKTWRTIKKTTTITAEGTSSKTEILKEEPVLASETESSMKEVATRLASEHADDFDSGV